MRKIKLALALLLPLSCTYAQETAGPIFNFSTKISSTAGRELYLDTTTLTATKGKNDGKLVGAIVKIVMDEALVQDTDKGKFSVKTFVNAVMVDCEVPAMIILSSKLFDPRGNLLAKVSGPRLYEDAQTPGHPITEFRKYLCQSGVKTTPFGENAKNPRYVEYWK